MKARRCDSRPSVVSRAERRRRRCSGDNCTIGPKAGDGTQHDSLDAVRARFATDSRCRGRPRDPGNWRPAYHSRGSRKHMKDATSIGYTANDALARFPTAYLPFIERYRESTVNIHVTDRVVPRASRAQMSNGSSIPRTGGGQRRDTKSANQHITFGRGCVDTSGIAGGTSATRSRPHSLATHDALWLTDGHGYPILQVDRPEREAARPSVEERRPPPP